MADYPRETKEHQTFTILRDGQPMTDSLDTVEVCVVPVTYGSAYPRPLDWSPALIVTTAVGTNKPAVWVTGLPVGDYAIWYRITTGTGPDDEIPVGLATGTFTIT